MDDQLLIFRKEVRLMREAQRTFHHLRKKAVETARVNAAKVRMDKLQRSVDLMASTTDCIQAPLFDASV